MKQTLSKFILLSILLISGCSNQKASDNSSDVSEEDSMEADIKVLSQADSTYLSSLIADLKGIDKFAVKDNYFFFRDLLIKKGDKKADTVKSILKGIKYIHDAFQFYISVYEPKNGYIEYTPGAVESTISMVYWNVSDGSKLIAIQEISCGPVCESEIFFQKYQDGQYQTADNIIPSIKELNERLYPNAAQASDPLEFYFVLPRKGKDLNYCLDEECLMLKWEDGTFVLSEGT